ncbi:MAG: SgcJ/EcaC family oxidoreductase [Gemmatimonadota bacterium]
MKRPVGLLVPLTLFVLGACAAEPDADAALDQATTMVDLAAEEQAIRDRVAAWQDAANESPEAFAAFYASDGVLMPPNGPAAEGPAAIAEAMGPMFETVEEIAFEVVDITFAESGELAVERGRYTLAGTLPDGTSFDDAGSYLVAWQKQDGAWMVLYDIFNSDRPAQ